MRKKTAHLSGCQLLARLRNNAAVDGGEPLIVTRNRMTDNFVFNQFPAVRATV